MANPTFQDNIKTAIAAHGVWKVDLDQAVATGASHRKVDESKRDDACTFGKWLRTVDGGHKGPEYTKVMDLHARFHQEAAHVLSLALAGKKDEARKALDILGPFASTSASLTRAMVDWSKASG